MSNYLTERRKELGLTMKQVAEAIGVSEATVSRWESGLIANMRRDRINNYAKVLRTSPSFIMTGQIEEKTSSIFDIPGVHPLPKTYTVPLLGAIACGDPILAEQNIAEIISVPEAVKGADFALTCKGDSMINARIFDGDIVYIHMQDTVENGEITAVLIGDEATLKKVYYTPGGDRITLRPCNPLYPDMEYAGEELREIRILGKAIAFTSTIR